MSNSRVNGFGFEISRLKMSFKSDSSVFTVLHCASLLRTIFLSLAWANERVHVHNEKSFPQAKLDSEINVPFLLNVHGDLKKIYRTEKQI